MKQIVTVFLVSVILSACTTKLVPEPTSYATPFPTAVPSSSPSPATTTQNKITMVYQPMQCQETPWGVWYALGEVNFIKAPTETELISAYYSSQSIEISNPQKIVQDIMVCEACDTCATAHKFTVQTTPDMVEKLAATGWKQE